MGKIKLQKIVGNLLDKRREFYMNGTIIWKFLVVLKWYKILGNICLSEQMNKFRILRQREMWFLYTGFALHASIWVIANCGL